MNARTGRPGFAAVDVLAVLLALTILARVAVPVYRAVRLRADAAAALRDLEAVQRSARQYNADTGGWPADRYAGELPPELRPYLGADFSFTRDPYQLDWENWALPQGTPRHPDTTMLLGVSVVTADARLGRAFRELLGSADSYYTLGDHHTFVTLSGP